MMKNFRTFGASEERVKDFVRAPGPADVREPGWRVIDAALGDIEEGESEREYGTTHPDDTTVLYYWRETYWRKRVA